MSRMTERPDLFARRNRLRILGLLALATVVYWLAVCAVAVGTALGIVFLVIGNAGFPDSVDLLKWFGIGVAVLVGLSIVVGTFLALVRVPFRPRQAERRVLRETGAPFARPDDHPEVRNLLEGLAIAADVPVPRFAVIQDPAPNSFGVGTR